MGDDVQEEVPTFELGDRVIVIGGEKDKTRGHIYYMDGNLIRILPDGVSDRLVDLPLEEGDFAESLGIENFFMLEKAPTADFVALLNAQVGDIADTFQAGGEPGVQYTIKSISEAEDSMVIVDETGAEKVLEFRGEMHRGIEASEPFAVLRPRPPPSAANMGEEPSNTEEGAEGAEAAEGENEFGFGVVEEPEEMEISFGFKERPAVSRLYPDKIQCDEMYTDLIDLIPDVHSQRNPKRQKEMRQLMEQLRLLRNELVRYSDIGDPAGQLPTSYQTIAELLEKGDIPLARPVLEAKRSVYIPMEIATKDNPNPNNPRSIPGVEIDINYEHEILPEAKEFLETQLGGTAAQVLGGADMLPAWYLTWDTFFKRYMRTFISDSQPGAIFRGDKEFLRAPAPVLDEATVDGIPPFGDLGSKKKKKVASIPSSVLDTDAMNARDEEDRNAIVEQQLEEEKAEKEKKPMVIFKSGFGLINPLTPYGKLQLSLLKGLGPRYTRLKTKDVLRKVESAEEGVVVNQLLFPLSAERDLGVTRTGSLARDINLSLGTQRGLLRILQALGGIVENPGAGNILCLGQGGNTNGNIAIEEWLRAQPLKIRGLGDALVQLRSLGLTQRELTTDQQSVLLDKLKTYRAMINQYITEQNEKAGKELAGLRLENITFLQGEALEELMAILASEPLLAARQDELRKLLPAYRDNDIAIVAGISAQMADLFLAAYAGQPAPLARERNRRVRDEFLAALRNAMKKAAYKEGEGEIPEPNRCPHVADLNAIRRIRDHSDRMNTLAKFITNFKSGRKDNWLSCNSCSKHLLCYHEELQLEEFKHPNDKERIHKELLLSFSGGTFHGHFMCKNCGQFLQELDFDRGVEFDEEGRPMAASAALMEEDTTVEEALDLLVGDFAEDEEGTKAEEEVKPIFQGDTQKLIYRTALKIYQRVGILPPRDTMRSLIQRIEAEIQSYPSRDQYARKVAADAKKGVTKKALDYDTYINRNLVLAVATHVLVEIQCHVPDYVPNSRIPGCMSGFSGYPIGREQDKTGINYIACAVAGITENKAPWSLTGFLTLGDKKRQEVISASLVNFVGGVLRTAAVQQMLTEKRAHYEKLYGKRAADETLPERVPDGFRPVPYAPTAEEAAQAIVIPDAATPMESVRGWIQMGHRIARQNGVYMPGSPYSETTCCTTTVNQPRGFWKEKETAVGGLPALPPKAAPHGQNGSQAMFRFKPRRLAKLLADPPEDLFYRVFLRVCYDGPRKGLPHEPGYTNTCGSCGFVFPESPYIEAPAPPQSKDLLKEWQTETDAIITRGKAALETQKVMINRESFQALLDTTHMAYRVSLAEKKQPAVGTALLMKLGELDPQPFQGWRSIVLQTMERLASLPPNTRDEMEVTRAYELMANHAAEVIGDITRRLGVEAAQSLQSVMNKSPPEVVEAVRTYFLVVFQRLLTGFHVESLQVSRSYDLFEDIKEDLEKAMTAHLGYLPTLQKAVKGYARVKLQAAQRALTAVLPLLQNEVRAGLVPGGALGLPFLVGSLVLGILGEFINPNVVPEGLEGGYGGVVEPTARVPLNIMDVCIKKMQAEAITLTETQIRDMLEQRVEAEKQMFIMRMDRMNPEEKRMTLMNKRLGLKEWAVGGTKAIYRLDESQYALEKQQREDMGITTSFGGDAGLEATLMAFRQEENYGGGGMGAESGYDNEQTGADDW